MNYLKRTKVKSTTLNLHKRINNKVFVTKTSLYCNTCGKSIQENPILCYMFIDFFVLKNVMFKNIRYTWKSHSLVSLPRGGLWLYYF